MSKQPTNLTASKTTVWALVGNPNAGKTSLFNALCGTRHPVGNYPGVTVEKRSGELLDQTNQNKNILLDLPGTYSLKAHSPDEQITCSVLLGKLPGSPKPDFILFVADSTNLHRNFFLLSQLTELKIPMLVVLTMADELKNMGMQLDAKQIERKLGVPVVLMNTRHGEDIKRLRELMETVSVQPSFKYPLCIFPFVPSSAAQPLVSAQIEAQPKLFEQDFSEERYHWIAQILDPAITLNLSTQASVSERIDAWLTHPRWGLLFFVVIMFCVFFSIYTIAQPLMDQIDAGFKNFAHWLGFHLSSTPILQSLVTDGIIGGVGAVLAFTPQIMILFAFVAVLEDSGYMARAAFMMDRLLAWSGLNGRSFIPLLSSFACAVPGILSARVISDPKARLSTILIAPLMSCSARLPVYLLMIGTFIQPLYGTFWAALALLLIHSLGLFYALPMAWLLNSQILKTPTQPFILEMPSYRLPQFKTVVYRVRDTTLSFLKQAGSIILAITILIWALSYFPHHVPSELNTPSPIATDTFYLEQSYLGQLGKALEPAFKPLGFDWRITIGILSAFPAREVIVSTFGILFELGANTTEGDPSLKNQLRKAQNSDHTPLFNPLIAVNLMIFFALCCQCSATLVTIKHELGSWKWPIFVFVYMSSLAYISSLLVYQVGKNFL